MAIPPPFAPAGSRLTGSTAPGAGWRGIGGGWWAPPKPGATATSITQQAIAGHPNWASPTPAQPPASIISQAIAGHPNWSGITPANQAVIAGNAPAATPATPPPAATPAATPTAPPLDSTYYQNVADNQARIGNQIGALTLQGTQDQTALQTALAALAYQQPRDQLALEQRANQGGGLYSSVENLNQANLAHAYATRADTANTTYNTAIDRLATQIAGLQGGGTQYEHEQQTASGQRAATLAANAPAPAAPKAAAAPTPPKNAPAGSRHTGPVPPGPKWRGLGGGWWAPPLTSGKK